jgi:hypothetical protein
VAPMPTLAPLPPMNADIGGGQFSQPAPSIPSFQSRSFLPVMRTGGS